MRTVELARLRPLDLQCANPQTLVRITHPALAEAIEGTCAELTSMPLLLPEGELSFALERTHYRSQNLKLTLNQDNQAFSIPELEAMPVPLSITCADPDREEIELQIGELTSSCPLEAELPPGRYELRAVKSNGNTWSRQVELSHDRGHLHAEVPPIKGDALFWAGAITASAGGALILGGAAVDIAGLDTLDDLERSSRVNVTGSALRIAALDTKNSKMTWIKQSSSPASSMALAYSPLLRVADSCSITTSMMRVMSSSPSSPRSGQTEQERRSSYASDQWGCLGTARAQRASARGWGNQTRHIAHAHRPHPHQPRIEHLSELTHRAHSVGARKRARSPWPS